MKISILSYVLNQSRPASFFSLLLIPPLIATFILLKKSFAFEELKYQFLEAQKKQRVAFENLKEKTDLFTLHTDQNPDFFEEQIASFPLLEKEKEALKKMKDHPAFLENQKIEKRLKFLEKNQFHFQEKSAKKSSFVKETKVIQTKSVEMDEDDFKRLLSLIENTDPAFQKIQKPQLLPEKIWIQKKKNPFGKEVLEVKMDLLKREFCKQ